MKRSCEVDMLFLHAILSTLGGAPTPETKKERDSWDFARVVDPLWETLLQEPHWVIQGFLRGIIFTHWSNLECVLSSLDIYYEDLKAKQKKKGKLALMKIVLVYQNLAQGIGFSQGLAWTLQCDEENLEKNLETNSRKSLPRVPSVSGQPPPPSSRKAVTPNFIFKKFINFIFSTKEQLWPEEKKDGKDSKAKRLKPKWANTILDLVVLVARLARALNQIEISWMDKLLTMWPLEDRYLLFKWLDQFAKDPGLVPHPKNGSSEEEIKYNLQVREHNIKTNCVVALEHLCGLGKTIPNLNLKDHNFTSFFSLLNDHLLFSVLLCYHAHYMIGFCLKQIFSQPAQIQDLFFRATAEIFLSSINYETRSNTGKRSLSSVIEPKRIKATLLAFLDVATSQSLQGNLVFLSLLNLAHDDFQTRYDSYEMLKTVCSNTISAEFGDVLLKYQFVFQSRIDSWARRGALKISEEVATAIIARENSLLPKDTDGIRSIFPHTPIAFQLVRQAMMCLETNTYNGGQREWILELILPWFDHIVLRHAQLGEFWTGGVNHRPEEVKDASWYSCGNKSVSFQLQHFLYNTLIQGRIPLDRVLPVYKKLGKVASNITAIISFMLDRMTHNFAEEDLYYCKAILFVIYENESSQALILRSLMYYLLRVLRQNAAYLESTNLQNRLASSKILSALQNVGKAGVFCLYSLDFGHYAVVRDATPIQNVVKKDVRESLILKKEDDFSHAARFSVSSRMSFFSTGNEVADLLLREANREHASAAAEALKLQEQKDERDTQRLESHLCAEMLIELIGAATPELIEYFFCDILLYAFVFLDDADANVKKSMQRLVTRLLCAYTCTTFGALRTYKPNLVDNVTNPSLSRALMAERLSVTWPDMSGDANQQSGAIFNTGVINMPATLFISLVVDFLRVMRY